MIRRPPRSTLDRSSAASDVYKRQVSRDAREQRRRFHDRDGVDALAAARIGNAHNVDAVSYTHLRAHETVLDLVCRLLLEKKKTYKKHVYTTVTYHQKTTSIYILTRTYTT